MFAQKLAAFTMTHLGPWETSLGLRSISAENMGRRSGNVRNVLSAMLFSLIGRLTLKHVEQGNIDATVEPFFLGNHLDP